MGPQHRRETYGGEREKKNGARQLREEGEKRKKTLDKQAEMEIDAGGDTCGYGERATEMETNINF